jgi:uncharacterized protein (TIGR03435 family)
MAADAHPTLAVAIHPARSEHARQGFNFEGSRYMVRNQSVAGLMMFAYVMHPKQIVDEPEWVRSER